MRDQSQDRDGGDGKNGKRAAAAGFGFALTVPLAATAAAMPPPDSGAPSPTTTVGGKTSKPADPKPAAKPAQQAQPARRAPSGPPPGFQQGMANKRHAVDVATRHDDPPPRRPVAARAPQPKAQPRPAAPRPRPHPTAQPAKQAPVRPSPAQQQGMANKRHAIDVSTNEGQPAPVPTPPQPAAQTQPAAQPQPAVQPQPTARPQPATTSTAPARTRPSAAQRQGMANKRHAIQVATEPDPSTASQPTPDYRGAKTTTPATPPPVGTQAAAPKRPLSTFQQGMANKRHAVEVATDRGDERPPPETHKAHTHQVPSASYDGPLKWAPGLAGGGLDHAGDRGYTHESGKSFEGDGKHKATRGAGIDFTSFVTLLTGRSGEHFTDDGKRRVTLNARLEHGNGVEVNYDGKVIDAEGHTVYSSGYDYTVVLDPDRADDVSNGRSKAPTPTDPRTFKDGDSVELGHDASHGYGYSASYRGVGVGEDVTKSKAQTGGVQKVNSHTMRVYVGDQRAVQRALGLNLGSGKLGLSVSLGALTSGHGHLTAVDLDLSTAAGRRAYRDFVASGHTPKVTRPDQPGVLDASTSKEITSEEGPPSIDVGPIHRSFGDVSYDGRQSRATHVDGSVDRTIEIRDNDVTMRSHEVTDPTGVPGQTTYTLALKNADGRSLQQYHSVTGGYDAHDHGTRDVVVSFTADQLMQLRDDVRQAVSADSQHTNQPMTPDEVDATVRAKKSIPYRPGSGYDASILSARTPRQLMLVLLNEAHGSSGGALDVLTDIKLQHARTGKRPATDYGQPGTLR